jgi:hypothetical protein
MLLIYGVSGSITAGTHLITILGAPSQGDPYVDPNIRQFALSDKQRWDLVLPFAMFLGIPLIIILDMSVRILTLMRPGIAASKTKAKNE